MNKSNIISYDCFVCCRMVKTKITPRKAPAKKPQETEKPFSCVTCGTRFMKRAYMNVHIKKFHTGSSYSKIVSPSTSSKSVVSPSTSLKSVVSPSFSSPKELDLTMRTCQILKLNYWRQRVMKVLRVVLRL